MTVGVKYDVVVVKNAAGNPVIERINFRGRFSYGAGVTTTSVVTRNLHGLADTSVKGATLNRYVVTTFYVAGDEPNLGTKTINAMVSDAVTAINAAYASEFALTTPAATTTIPDPEPQ